MARRLEEEELWEGRVARICWEGKEERWRGMEPGQVKAREGARQQEGKKWLEWWEGRRRDRKLKQKYKEEEALAEWADGEWKDWTAWMKALQEPAWGRWKCQVRMAEEEDYAMNYVPCYELCPTAAVFVPLLSPSGNP